MRTALTLTLALAATAIADEHLVRNPNGPLDGKTVVFSPGHGYLNDGGTWRYQRGVLHEIREDIHTNEIFIEVIQRYLVNAGARVESVRERSFQTAEVIVDDPAATYAGTWGGPSTSNPAFHGAGYRFATVAAQETATATFALNVPRAGRYPVYVWWTRGANRASDARYTIVHGGGRTTVLVDQTQLGDHWVFLGDFWFAAGQGQVVLSNQGSDPTRVVVADAVRAGGGVGASGQPRWRESAQAFLAHKGFRTSSNDVTIRPIYATWLAGGDTAQWRDDFVYFALHTNAANQSATGLSTFSYSNGRTPAWDSAGPVTYPTSPSSLEAASDAYRDRAHAQVLADVRALVQPAWPDRRTHRMNFGEVREARNMRSTLLELGFHDSAADAALLRDAAFRHIAGRAIYKAILRGLVPNATVAPLPPDGLRLENLGGGRVRISWRGVTDPLEASAAPTGYKVYLSSDGLGFADGVAVNGTSFEAAGLAPGQLLFAKVTATNAGGEGLGSRVGGVRVGETGRVALLVDGFTRPWRHTEVNIARRYTYDYAREHLAALSQALPAGIPVDFAATEAVASGAVSLDPYGFVDWALGREGSEGRTFDPAEQAAVRAYLQGGGTLLASGSELAWDLGAQGGGTAFLEEAFGAAYLGDDAATSIARAPGGGPFAALAQNLDANTGRYPLESPDELETRGAAEVLLRWESAAAPAAGVGLRRRAVALGFPLETVGDGAQRAALVREALGFLAPMLSAGPPQTPPPPPPPPSGGGGSSTAPPASSSGTVTAGATPGPAPMGGGGGGGGCTMGGQAQPGGIAALVPLFLLLAARRRKKEAKWKGE